MLTKLESMLHQYEMLRSGDTVVCAVSGGADSMALLFGLYLLKDKWNVRLMAAHVNHGLRGAESDRDEAFVRQYCQMWDVPLAVHRVQVVPGAKGLEAAAREARYSFFDTLPGKIATAHTADDNAETVLMRLTRGTGLKGLGAIAPVRGRLIRPMLTVTRQQVMAFLNQYHIPYVEDSSNAEDAFLRNRIRHSIMPLFTQENPRFAENVSAMALRLREDEQLICGTEGFLEGLDISSLLTMPKAKQNRVIASFLEHIGVKEPESAHIALTLAVCRSENPSAKADLPGGVTVRRCYDRLIREETAQPLMRYVLQCPGVTQIPELALTVICQPAQSLEQSAGSFVVSPVGEPVIRCRQSGDSIRLHGGNKSVKKLFIDRKIPAHLRMRIPVLADDVSVLGVCGLGVNLDRAAQQLPAIQIRFVYQNSD